jgi:hypothetical protein
LSTQESGNVVRIGFESSARVQEGQALIELDRSVEEAHLRGALARNDTMKSQGFPDFHVPPPIPTFVDTTAAIDELPSYDSFDPAPESF